MLRAALVFFVLAFVAMALGFSNIGGVSMEIGQTLLTVFLILAAISFVAGMLTNRKPNLIP